MCVVVGVVTPRSRRNRYAFFKVHPRNKFHVPASGDEKVSIRSYDEEVAVFVDVVKDPNLPKATVTPSIVWFDSPKKGNPRGSDLCYFSLAHGALKFFRGPTQGELDLSQPLPVESIMGTNAICDMIKSTTHIVDRVPYAAYKVGGNTPGENDLSLLSSLRVCLYRSAIRVTIVKERHKSPFKIADVLVGPLGFESRAF
jgi:hypothetical protein